MIIIFSPQVSNSTLVVEKLGDVLTINGVEYDFSPLVEGGVLDRLATDCEFLHAGPVTRTGGELTVHLILPISHGAGESACFPQPMINVADGPVELPK